MPKPRQPQGLFEVECPCCRATLKVDPDTRHVISYKEAEKPKNPLIEEDISSAVERLKGEAAKREEIFQKSFAGQKTHQDVLSKKFDELLKQAKEEPAEPPKRPFDLD